MVHINLSTNKMLWYLLSTCAHDPIHDCNRDRLSDTYQDMNAVVEELCDAASTQTGGGRQQAAEPPHRHATQLENFKKTLPFLIYLLIQYIHKILLKFSLEYGRPDPDKRWRRFGAHPLKRRFGAPPNLLGTHEEIKEILNSFNKAQNPQNQRIVFNFQKIIFYDQEVPRHHLALCELIPKMCDRDMMFTDRHSLPIMKRSVEFLIRVFASEHTHIRIPQHLDIHTNLLQVVASIRDVPHSHLALWAAASAQWSHLPCSWLPR